MLKRIFSAIAAALIAGAAFAQTTTADLEARLAALQQKVAQLDDMKQQIDVLTQEIEALKSGERKKSAAEAAPMSQYGLGDAASKVYHADQGVSFGGYGEFTYQNPQGGEKTADLLRAVLYTGYKFNDRMLFNSEMEVEHASTERAGAVSMEFAYLDYVVHPQATVRAGLLLVPMGIVNEQHEPTAYLGARRPQTERIIIPSTWSEIGAGVVGDAGKFSYRAYVMNSIATEELGGEMGIHETPQKGSEANAAHPAMVARLDFHPFEGTIFGGSAYRGSIGNGSAGRVSVAEVHADSRFRGLSLRGVVARGRTGLLAQEVDPDDPIGRTFGGWYVEGGYDVTSLVGARNFSVTPYLRYEQLNTQRSMPAGFTPNRENDLRLFSAGLDLKPITQTVLKLEWLRQRNGFGEKRNQYNATLGYIF